MFRLRGGGSEKLYGRSRGEKKSVMVSFSFRLGNKKVKSTFYPAIPPASEVPQSQTCSRIRHQSYRVPSPFCTRTSASTSMISQSINAGTSAPFIPMSAAPWRSGMENGNEVRAFDSHRRGGKLEEEVWGLMSGLEIARSVYWLFEFADGGVCV